MTAMSSHMIFRTATMLALAAVVLQVLTAVCNAQASGSTSGAVMVPLECLSCKSGYICAERENGTYYCKKSCIRDCTGEPRLVPPICGTDKKNYTSICELENTACKEDRWIGVNEDDTSCQMTNQSTNQTKLTSNCREQQEEYKRRLKDRSQRCSISKFFKKAIRGTLQWSDLKWEDNCHEPQCKGNDFAVRQCVEYNWCWCSDGTDGTPINRIFQQNLPKGTCENRCGNHANGAIFKKEGGCGLCQCLNGNVTCYEDYNTTKTLSADQLEKLREELLKIFWFQYNNKDNEDNLDLTPYISTIKQASEVSQLSQKTRVLRFKFNEKYDSNKDGQLSSTEWHMFKDELENFLVGCSNISELIITKIIDTDSDMEITWSEWAGFYAEELRDSSNLPSDYTSSEGSSLIVGKRSIDTGLRQIGRKPLSLRKKFLYTFLDH